MKLTKYLMLAGSAAVLAACSMGSSVGPVTGSTEDLKMLSAATPQGSAFDKALAGEYLALADFEANKMYDLYDQQLFAKKGLAAASGTSPDLEESQYWNLTPANAAEVDSVREKLSGLLANGSKDRTPKWAAIAQAKFDCWVEQLEENFQPDHINACKQDLDEAMPYLVKKEVAAPAPKPEPKPAPKPAAAPKLPEAFVIFFDFDSADLSSISKLVAGAIADAHKAHPNAQITLEGHTDSSGAAAYNQKLSEARVAAVQGELSRLGVNGNNLSGKAVGESNLAVATDDNVKEARNRRVVVTFN